jgi:hypothetical protein
VDLVLTADDDGGDDDRLDAVPASTPTAEDALIMIVQSRQGLRDVVQKLAVLAEFCREDREALLDVIEEMRAYLRERLIEAGRHERPLAPDGRDWSQLTLDDLAEAVDPDLVEVSKAAMYKQIRQRLGLEGKTARNRFDQRMRDIREL